ncbi:MAG TPA: hypothetical protein VFY85_01740 [Gemmatimonadaceae bacterium]|nr:hypothetical protein [Gemmatimonadaceae bacterium]
MIRSLGVLATAALLLAPHGAQAQDSPLWRTVDIARQLHDSEPQRIRVQYGAGRVDVRGSADPLLYNMHLRYDERRAAPVHRYDAAARSAVLGLETRDGAQRFGDRDDSGELRLVLPTSAPLDLDLQLGGTESRLELGGLTLRSLRLECGATDASVAFSQPNRTQMSDLTIDVGVADLLAVNLADANADQIRVNGGVGVVDLDFGGRWTRDLTLDTRLTVGKLILRVPADVGIRLDLDRLLAGFDHEGMVKRDGAWYSTNYDAAPHKLQVRAATFFGQVELRRTSR